MNLPADLFGITVVESLLAVEQVPARPFPGKPGMRPQYVKRIAKKWLKRWGTISRPCFYMFGSGTIFAHPSLMPALREAIKKQPPPAPKVRVDTLWPHTNPASVLNIRNVC